MPPISTVATDEAVKASTMNAVIQNVNAVNGRAFYVSNGTWSVPVGVQRFKVTLCGGGGRGRPSVNIGGGEDTSTIAGGEGGDSPMVSAVITGYDSGTTFNITIGAGGTVGTPTGGTTSFGTIFSSSGGQLGGASSGAWYDAITPKGAAGAPTFPGGVPHVYHCNEILCRRYRFTELIGYGKGGLGGPGYSGYGGTYEHLHSPGPEDGEPGCVMIEW